MPHTELYETLDVETNASTDEINKAFRKLAVKYHPDKNKDLGAEDMFKKITHAHDILSDPDKRQIYDQFGEDGLQSGLGDGMDPMAAFFGRMHQENNRKMATKKEYNITLEEYFTKKYISIEIPRNIVCDNCDATGFTDKKRHSCKHCRGSGFVMKVMQQGPIIQQFQSMCPSCNGKKIDTSMTGNICPNCNAQGTKQSYEKIDVMVPSNILVNPVTIVPDKGDWTDNRYIDLAIIFKLRMNKNFSLTSDKKLIYMMHINYPETICGFRRIIKHPSGKNILVVAEKGYVINPDNIYFIDKLGFNDDVMYLSFVIHYPEKINIPTTKTLLSFRSLEMILGERNEPNIVNDSGIDPENIYTLSTLNKINNNPRSQNNNDEEDEEYDEPEDHGHGIGCNQQ